MQMRSESSARIKTALIDDTQLKHLPTSFDETRGIRTLASLIKSQVCTATPWSQFCIGTRSDTQSAAKVHNFQEVSALSRSSVQPKDRRKSSEAGFDEHPGKPVGLEDLKKVLV